MLTSRPQTPLPLVDPGEFLAPRTARGSMGGGAHEAHHRVMEFGSRWQESLRTIDAGVRLAVARLELPERYRDEIGTYQIHPALMDLETGFHRWALLDGPQGEQSEQDGTEPARDFYLPLAYDRLVVHAPMPTESISGIRPTSASSRAKRSASWTYGPTAPTAPSSWRSRTSRRSPPGAPCGTRARYPRTTG
ncbi:polyketide synthase dehydratase domain-containing protein [Streptomyces sp. NPDC005900]|uniref:polyketide synthase dehydratase domain-containing protein n=1 Tax=Streptomyces sp. NPDC005900 TaxID=3154569 RepID=UPI0033C57F92